MAIINLLKWKWNQTINEELRLGHTGPYDGQLKSLTHRQSFRFAFENHSDLGDDGVRLGLLARLSQLGTDSTVKLLI